MFCRFLRVYFSILIFYLRYKTLKKNKIFYSWSRAWILTFFSLCNYFSFINSHLCSTLMACPPKKYICPTFLPLDANLEKRKKYKSGISNRYILSRTKDYTRNESLQNNQQKKKPKIVHGNEFL